MQKIVLTFIITLYCLTIQIGYAEENNTLPVYVNINNSETKPIVFGPDKIAKIEVPPDPIHKTALISLAPGSHAKMRLLSFNNQEITTNQSANCPISASFPTTLTFVDDDWTPPHKAALEIGLPVGIIEMTIAGISYGLTIGLCTGIFVGGAAALMGVMIIGKNSF